MQYDRRGALQAVVSCRHCKLFLAKGLQPDQSGYRKVEECADARGHQPSGREHEMDRQRRRLEGLQNSDKAARPDRLLDLVGQNSRDTPAVRCRFDCHLHLVDLEPRLELHGLRLPAVSLKPPQNIAGLAGDCDDLMSR